MIAILGIMREINAKKRIINGCVQRNIDNIYDMCSHYAIFPLNLSTNYFSDYVNLTIFLAKRVNILPVGKLEHLLLYIFLFAICQFLVLLWISLIVENGTIKRAISGGIK